MAFSVPGKKVKICPVVIDSRLKKQTGENNTYSSANGRKLSLRGRLAGSRCARLDLGAVQVLGRAVRILRALASSDLKRPPEVPLVSLGIQWFLVLTKNRKLGAGFLKRPPRCDLARLPSFSDLTRTLCWASQEPRGKLAIWDPKEGHPHWGCESPFGAPDRQSRPVPLALHVKNWWL